MKNKTIPITSLRDTGALDELVNNSKEPIIVTKNGYDDFVIVPKNCNNGNDFSTPKLDDSLGFVRLCSSSFNITVGDPLANAEQICRNSIKASKEQVDIIVFQELTLVGVTASDLLFFSSLKRKVEEAIEYIKEKTKGIETLIIFGAPLETKKGLQNASIIMQNGIILAVVPKIEMATNRYNNEERIFASYDNDEEILINGKFYKFGKFVFQHDCEKAYTFSVEIGNELLSDNHKINLNRQLSSIIINQGGFLRNLNSKEELKDLVKSISLKNHNCYCLTDASSNEATNDGVYGNGNLLYENGILQEYSETSIIMDIDLDCINSSRASMKGEKKSLIETKTIIFHQDRKDKKSILRNIVKAPFLTKLNGDVIEAKEIIDIQARALANRVAKTKTKIAVIGLSGGLDSALALVATVEAFKLLKKPLSDIHCFSLPCFGTTNRTKNNSKDLAHFLGVHFEEIDISKAVEVHLNDLKIDEANRSVAFENAQARERTQYLMDYSNLKGGMVIGTGDLSELALGWCTYNGDHMSMYGINAGIPKTMVKFLIHAYCEIQPKLKSVLGDILDTPISPELIPGTNKKMCQLTESIIGPYDLQDFYIYNFLKYGYRPRKLFVLAKEAFKGIYDENELKKWLKVFITRFFSSQFKRNAIPDGPAILDFNLSPREFLRLPSDLESNIFLKEIDNF